MLLLAERLKATVMAYPGGSVEDSCRKKGLKFLPFSLSLLLRTAPSHRGFITCRSKATLLCAAVAIPLGKRVVRLNFTGKRYPVDGLVEVVPLERLGWIRHHGEGRLKTGGLKVALVCRLKRERKVEELMEELCSCRVNFKLVVVGGGELPPIHGGALKVVHIKKKVNAYRKLLSKMDVLLYHTAGTDKTCRAVLEAMDEGVCVVSCEPLTKRYINGKNAIFCRRPQEALDRVLLLPALLKRVSANASKYIRRFWIEEVRLPFEDSPGDIKIRL